MCWLGGREPGRESLSSFGIKFLKIFYIAQEGSSLSGEVGLSRLVIEKDYTVVLVLTLVEVKPS